MCADGFYGDPLRNIPCQACQCNGNIDRNAVGNCNRTTGECLKCIYNTNEFNCQSCRPGHYGNPLSPNQSDKCKVCVRGRERERFSSCNWHHGNLICSRYVGLPSADIWFLFLLFACETCWLSILFPSLPAVWLLRAWDRLWSPRNTAMRQYNGPVSLSPSRHEQEV